MWFIAFLACLHLAKGENRVWKVMAIGDSITQGGGTSSNWRYLVIDNGPSGCSYSSFGTRYREPDPYPSQSHPSRRFAMNGLGGALMN